MTTRTLGLMLAVLLGLPGAACWMHQGAPLDRPAGVERADARRALDRGDGVAAEHLLDRAARLHPGSIEAVYATLDRFAWSELALQAAAVGGLGVRRVAPEPIDACRDSAGDDEAHPTQLP